MTLASLITAIKAVIYPNGAEEITGQILQDTLVQMAQTGVTPSGDPMHYAYVTCGATWNDSTGYWELNGLTNLTNEQMQIIYSVNNPVQLSAQSYAFAQYYKNSGPITTFPFAAAQQLPKLVSNVILTWNYSVQTLCFTWGSDAAGLVPTVSGINNFQIWYFGALTTIIDIIQCSAQFNINPFNGCSKLENVKLSGVAANLQLSSTAVLSLDSLTYLVNNAANTGAITVTVHPTIYGYLTDQSGYPDWYALAQTAAGKNISFVSA